MEYLYVDESGSLTKEHSDAFPFFVICTIRVKNVEKLKKRYKRFVSKYFDALKECGNGKMFEGERFKELKGSSFTFEMKKNFVDYFCKSDLFEIYYIRVVNEKVKPHLYENTARAFNFFYKLKLSYFLKKKILPNDEYLIQFDNRNQKNDSINSLEDYLNIELHLSEGLADEIHVKYFQSENNHLIQIADVFSNIYYSYCHQTRTYQPLINIMSKQKMLKGIFKFPFVRG